MPLRRPAVPARDASRERGLTTRAALAALLLLALAIPAFWPDYLAKLPSGDGYTHAHALLGTLWLLALIVQPLLVRARKLHVHRVLGRIVVPIGIAFLISSVLLTHHRVSRMDAALFEQHGSGFYLPLVMAAFFAAAFVLGLLWRRVMPIHARFMICTALPLIDPVTARALYFYAPPLPAEFLYQVPGFTVAVAVMVVLWRTLSLSAPGRRTFLSFVVAATVFLLLHFATPYSAAWMQAMRWFRSLPLT